MERYEVKPIFQNFNADKIWNRTVSVPGSKSITNRALLIAALAAGDSKLQGVLFSDDSRYFLSCLQSLGFSLSIDEANATVTVKGESGVIPRKEAAVYVGSAGTAARFLTAMLGLSKGQYTMDSSEQMKKRPMRALLKALEELGTQIQYQEKDGFFPFKAGMTTLKKQEISVDVGSSSQFLSALLMSCVILNQDMQITMEGNHALTYIDMTMHMMQAFGCDVDCPKPRVYRIAAHSSYQGRTYQIEPDVSGAAYFYAMAALLGGSMLVRHVHFDSLQGDIRFLRILEQMGCTLLEEQEGIRLTGPKNGALHGIDVNMGSCSDQTMTLAALAPFADSPVRIRNVGHIRLQESNRMEAIQRELTKLGVSCHILGDDILIEPSVPCAGVVETYEDHRMAMAFSLIGLRVPGIVIDNPMCCRKTFETYFDLLDWICREEG